MKRVFYALSFAITALGFAVCVATPASAATLTFIPNGGTGTSTAPVSQLLYGGSSAFQSVATSSAGCGTGLTCTGAAVVGPASFTPALSVPVSIANGGTNVVSFTTSGNGIYYNGTSLLTAPTTAAVTYPLASSTAISSTGSVFFATGGGSVAVGTSTPNWLLDLVGTRPSIDLSDSGAGNNLKHWLISSTGGNLYIGTSTDAYGTSTPAAISILNKGSVGIGTSSPGSLLSLGSIANFTTATSTFYSTGGLNLTAGCYAVNNTCITGGGGGAVSSVANSDSTLTISPTTGSVIASLNLVHPNTWTGLQQFAGNASSTLLSVFTKTYFGATATSTFDSAGNLALVSNGLTVGSNQLVVSSGNVGVATGTPWGLLSVNPSGISGPAFAIGSSTQTYWKTTNGGQSSSCETVYGNTANGAQYASSTSITVDFQKSCNQALLQIGTAGVTVTVQNALPGDTKRIVVANPTNASGGTITWSGVVWVGGAAPTQTTTANSGDVYSCIGTQATSTTSGSVKIECQPSNGLE